MIEFYDHQKLAIERLKSGSILCGGVGSGKSITALGFYFLKECGGDLKTMKMKNPKDLYIITTAMKRDTFEWNDECAQYYVKYVDGTATYEIWVEDKESMTARFNVMKNYDIAGVAGWKLGLESDDIWPLIRDNFYAP